jgi:tRNA/tmRNA/rRNA uracil-C5-methylase (TrmA/RlmC/RlmD family)
MAGVNVGDEITVEPIELVAGGDALARVDGFPIFSTNIFPGDVAVVRLYEVRKGFAKASLVRIVTPSPFRRLQPCPVAGECGGCDWTALRLDKQLEAKRRILTESLRRIGKFDVTSLPPVAVHPSPLNYRIRSRLQTDGEKTGFYAMRSNRVVPLPVECEVVGTTTAARFGERRLSESKIQNPEPEIDLAIWELDGELITDEREIMIRVAEFTYRLSTAAFFQVNRHLLPTLLRLMQDHARRVKTRHTAVDLYAGVGFFTVPLTRLFDRVIAIEGSPVSAKYARLNATAEVIEASAERANFPKADFIFLDPPRAGARKEVVASIAKQAREMICYLSCDPVTFARDANRLIASGWRLSTLDLLDLFPNTHHVETLASFERAG